MTRNLAIPSLVCLLLPALCLADTISLKSGRQIEGVVLQENPGSIVVRIGYGTIAYPRDQIVSIKRTPAIKEAPASAPTTARRIPGWNTVLSALLSRKWAADLQPIPATVIDNGVMRAVPYQSYRCGEDYEVNIYGDPDAPAAVEIGIYRALLNRPEAKENCLELITSVLGDKVDAGILRLLDRDQDLVTRKGLSIEITPPTAPDAYGGWWVSVYDEEALDAARASEAELNQITVARAPVPAPARPRSGSPSPPPRSQLAADDDEGAWTPGDYARARKSSSGAGRVYVRGYYRKDGTYVRPHTRRR